MDEENNWIVGQTLMNGSSLKDVESGKGLDMLRDEATGDGPPRSLTGGQKMDEERSAIP